MAKRLGTCAHCPRRRCAGKCRLPICKECGWKHYGRCRSPGRQYVKMVKRQRNPPEPRPLLTPLQDAILRFCLRYYRAHDYGPSLREIVGATPASSTSVVNYNLNKLEAKRYIKRAETQSIARSIRVTEKGRRYCDKNA